MKGKLIQNDDQYNKALSGLVMMAAELDDPLSPLSPEDKAKKQLIYDRTAALIQYYRRGQLVQSYPGLREAYQTLGWEWQEFGDPEASQSQPEQKEVPKQEPTKQELQQPEEPAPEPPKRNMSSWLDD